MNYLNRFSLAGTLTLLLGLFASSCHKEDSTLYEPMGASHFDTSLYVRIVDEQGRNLAEDSTFLRSVAFWGKETRRVLIAKVEKYKEWGSHFEVYTNPPNSLKHRDPKDSVGYAQSGLKISVNGKPLDVSVVYRYSYLPSRPDLLGGSGLVVVGAECADKTYSKDKSPYEHHRFYLPLLYKDGQLIPLEQ